MCAIPNFYQANSLGYSHFAKTARKDTEQTPKQPWKNYDLVSKKNKNTSPCH